MCITTIHTIYSIVELKMSKSAPMNYIDDVGFYSYTYIQAGNLTVFVFRQKVAFSILHGLKI